MPIRTRLTIWYAAVLTCLVVGISGVLVWRLHADLVHGVDQALTVRSQQTEIALEDPEDRREVLDLEVFRLSQTKRTVTPPGAVTQVVSESGRLIASTGDGLSRSLISPKVARELDDSRRSTAHVPGLGNYRVRASTLRRSPNILVVANSLKPVEGTTRRLLLLLALAIPAAIGASVGFGSVLARRALEPIDRMRSDADAIGADDAEARLDVPRVDDEVGRLGRTLNNMLDRLGKALLEQKRFTADASHELRTPLAIMQGELDVAMRANPDPQTHDLLQSLHEEVLRMSRLVDSLLTLMRADEGELELVRDEVDLADVARDVGSRLETSASTKGTHIDVRADQVVVWGDPDRLDQVLTNLVDNAVKHTPDGGEVRVVVRGDGDGHAVVEVADDGPGIAAADIAHVFDRFYRVDKARSRSQGGAGLGLAICRSIVQAHHGRIDVANAPTGGAVFTVTLPTRR